MAAERRFAFLPRDRRGQSLIEFVLILPALVGMFFLLLRVDQAIQVSIVNQKYSRQRLFELIGNSPQYPDLSRVPALVQKSDNRLVIGVSEETTLGIGTDFQPSAPTMRITRTKKAAEGGSNEAGKEPNRRADVRIRNTVEICTPILVSQSGTSSVPVASALSDVTFNRLTYCTGGIDE
jgi:hypothetical protein